MSKSRAEVGGKTRRGRFFRKLLQTNGGAPETRESEAVRSRESGAPDRPRATGRVEERQGYGDLLLAGLEATAAGTVADVLRSSALETAAGIWARVLAAAEVSGAPALTRRTRRMIGRQLIRAGEVAFLIEVRGGALQLLPVAQFEVLAGWRYRAEVIEPPGSSTSAVYPRAQVLHFTWETDPREPWAGISPLGSARLTATLAANVESKLGQEAGGPVAMLLPVPNDQGLGTLATDIAAAKGGAVLAEATSTGWDEGRQAAGTRQDWKASRLGPEIPDGMRVLYADTLARVCEACGIPAALVAERADGTQMREAYRRFIMASVEPVSELIADEASEKLESAVSFDFRGLWAHDLQGRANAYGSLRAAGMADEPARQAVGL